jgi:hypothetical protein
VGSIISRVMQHIYSFPTDSRRYTVASARDHISEWPAYAQAVPYSGKRKARRVVQYIYSFPTDSRSFTVAAARDHIFEWPAYVASQSSIIFPRVTLACTTTRGSALAAGGRDSSTRPTRVKGQRIIRTWRRGQLEHTVSIYPRIRVWSRAGKQT